MNRDGKIVGLLLLIASFSVVWFLFNFFEVMKAPSAFFLELRTENTKVIVTQEMSSVNLASDSLLSWSQKDEAFLQKTKFEIEKICNSPKGDQLRIGDSRIKANVMIDQVHKLAYCRHGKVGTTTFMEHFAKLLPKKVQLKSKFSQMTSHQLHDKVPGFFKLNNKDHDIHDEFQFGDYLVRNEVYTFSFVRHPFDRLVSAYYDKIVSDDDVSLKKRMLKVLHTYGEVTFSNFIKLVLDENKKFIHCESEKCGIDVHWRPFYLRCAYCLINYSFIGRIETFAKDVSHILQVRNLTHLIEDPTLQAHSTINASSGNLYDALTKDGKIPASKRALTEFATVEKHLIESLYSYYKPDFDLFLYSVEGFL